MSVVLLHLRRPGHGVDRVLPQHPSSNWPAGGAPGGTNAGMAPVHERAAALALGKNVVELGCCFGFLSLRLAAHGHRVTACFSVLGTVALLASVAPALGARLQGAGRGTRWPCRWPTAARTPCSRCTCWNICHPASMPWCWPRC